MRKPYSDPGSEDEDGDKASLASPYGSARQQFPGHEKAPPPHRDSDSVGLFILKLLISVLCTITVGFAVVYILWLNDAALPERIERSGQTLRYLFGSLVTAISALMFYFYKRSRW